MISVKLLHQKLEIAGIPIWGVSSDRIVNYKDEATPEQRSLGDAIAADFSEEDKEPSWDKLASVLIESSLRDRVRYVASQDIPGANRVALVLMELTTILTATHDKPRLLQAIEGLSQAMAAAGFPLTDEESSWVQQQLLECGFTNS